jgi:hypothetical protein
LIQNQPAPAAPATPAPAIVGTPVAAARGAPSASRELTTQLDDLQSTRREITGQLEDIAAGSPDRKPLETRMTDIDSRITSVDHLLAANATDIAKAAAIPGAVVERPPDIPHGPPPEAYVLGGMFMVIVFLPLSIAWARRIWRRSAAVVTSFPREIGERLLRMEQALEATSVEVERIGEGQRFLTRLFTEGEGTRSIGGGAAQPIERKSVKAPERLP